VSFFRIPSPSGGAERAKKGRTMCYNVFRNLGSEGCARIRGAMFFGCGFFFIFTLLNFSSYSMYVVIDNFSQCNSLAATAKLFLKKKEKRTGGETFQ
jgi:hypothetical protein